MGSNLTHMNLELTKGNQNSLISKSFSNLFKCEPLNGFGFRRGGYQCMCQPGYRYPPFENGPFKGEIIEKATREEYAYSFDCIAVDCKCCLKWNL